MSVYQPQGMKVATGSPTQMKVPRLRASVWIEAPIDVVALVTDRPSGAHVMRPQKITDAAGVLDDISILSTLKLDPAHPVKGRSAKWSSPLHAPFLTQARDQCHAAGIQLLAGYALADADGAGAVKIFLQWIRQQGTVASLTDHADDLLDFLDAQGFRDLDGLSFDIELNALNANDAPAFTTFYRYLAGKLAARNQILAVATGTGLPPGPAAALGTFNAQPFDMALGSPNFIIRPMAYDAFGVSDADFLQWQADVVDYALNTLGLPPSQFQLGLKTSNNVTPIPRPKKWPPPGWSARACCFDAGGVADRCQLVLRPRNVGVITFAGWIDHKAVDAKLNPNLSPSNRVGEPLQVPLTAVLS